jgi:hypothetical protein
MEAVQAKIAERSTSLRGLRQILGFLSGLVESLLPEVVEAVGEDKASQSDDGIGAVDGPFYAGLPGSLYDEAVASGLDDALLWLGIDIFVKE